MSTLSSLNLKARYEEFEAIEAAEYNKALSEGVNKKVREILVAESWISVDYIRYGYNGRKVNSAWMRVAAKAGHVSKVERERITKEFENVLMGAELEYVKVEMVESIPRCY